MKNLPLFIFCLISFTLLSSCDKENVGKKTTLSHLGASDLAGEYHFLYGQTSENTYTVPEDLGYQIGFRVSDDRVLYFKNGTQECDCDIIENSFLHESDSDLIILKCHQEKIEWFGFIRRQDTNQLESFIDFEENQEPGAEEYPRYYYQKAN